MSKNVNLSALKGITLASAGRSNGTSYTGVEKALALSVVAVVLTAAGIVDASKQATNEANEAVQAVVADAGKDAKHSVPSLCRAAYRSIESKRLADPATAADFPKKDEKGERAGRDYTSLGLLFRGAMKELGVAAEVIDQAFPSPYKAKKTA